MILEIYVIKDTVIGAFQNPYLQHNQAHALRTAKEAVNDQSNNTLKENTKDKQLWRLGKFNDVTGTIESNPEFIVNIVDLIEKPKENKEGE